MSAEEAKAEYIKKFGGFPEFLFMGATESVIVEEIKKALESGEEIKPVYEDGDY